MDTTIARVPGLPLLGNLLDFRNRRIPFLHRAAHSGDVVEARLGFFLVPITSSPALARELFVEKHEDFMKSAGISIFARPVLGNGLLTSEHAVHKRQRRMMAPIFAHGRIAGYAQEMAARAEVGAQALLAAGEADLAEHMMQVTLSIVGKTLFDTELSDDADSIGTALTGAMQGMLRSLLSVVPLPPSVPTPTNLRLRRAVVALDRIVYRLIRERRASGVDRGDLLGMLLAARDEDGSALTDEEVRDQAMTLMLAGHETTANALAWALYLLARNPEALARIQAQIDEVLGTRTVTHADLPRLPLAMQAFKESMRLYPPVYIIGRRALRDTTLGGRRVRKGRVVLANVSGMHRRADVYANPELFDLDRLTVEKEKALPPQAFMPFGGGPRVCIGNHFALMEGQILLTVLVQRLRMELVSTVEPETEPLITLRPLGGIRARVTPRLARSTTAAC